MGLFSEECQNPDCGARVKKGAHFCSHCGWQRGGRLVPCPTCKKTVGGASRFCWNCAADLAEERPPRIVDNRWMRHPAEIAVRIFPDELEGMLSRRVTVEPGTVGVLERNGKIVDTGKWTEQTLDSVFSAFKPTSIILLHAGDLVLRPTFRRLRDAGGAEVDVTIQLVFRISDFDAFTGHFFTATKRRVTFESLQGEIALELKDTARRLVNTHALDDMYGNLQWRETFEEELRQALAFTLTRYGLDLLQLNFAEFGGDHYEQLMADKGERAMGNLAADKLAAKVAIRRRMLESQVEGRVDQKEAEADLAKALDKIESDRLIETALTKHERDTTIEQAQHELVKRRRLRAFELEDMDQERTIQRDELQRELDTIEASHQNELAMSILVGRNERDAKQTEHDLAMARLRDEQTLEIEWKKSEQGRLAKRNETLDTLEAEERRAGMKNDRIRLIMEEQRKTHAQIKEKDAEMHQATIQGNVDIARAQHDAGRAAAEARYEELKSGKDEQREDARRHEDNLIRMASLVRGGDGAAAAAPGGTAHASNEKAPCPNCNKPVQIDFPNCPYCKTSLVKT